MQAYNKSNEQVQEVRIIDTTIKRSFKIVLDSQSAASFTGAQFNATFTVDLKQVVREAWRLKKAYNMTFNFVSSGLATTAELPPSVYTLHIDFGKGQNIYRYNNIKVPSGIVRLSNLASATAGISTVFFNSSDTDNAPVLIDNLLDITTVTLNLIDTASNSTFNSAGNATVNANTKYVCILTLTEA